MKEVGLKSVSEELILERLKFENSWWSMGKIDLDYEQMTRRLYFDLFFQLVSENEVRRSVVLMGPRRVGKTVLMHHAISALIEKGVSPKKIAFINIENPILLNIGLDQLFLFVRKAVADDDAKGWYIFFDEIQYLSDWEVHFKVMVDGYRGTRFIASGSAAAALKLKSSESGAGRFTDFMLPPLTFHEYIHLKKLNVLMHPLNIERPGGVSQIFGTINIKELNRHFIDYINYGGYPEVIFSDTIRANPGRYIRSDIIDKVLLRDLPSLYGIGNVQELNKLFATLAYNSGAEISYQSLSAMSGISKKVLLNYLIYLESAFLIKIVHRIDDNAQKFKRADFFKVYLTNPSLRSALFAPLEGTDNAMGMMVETAIFSQWLHREWRIPYYARWSKGRFQGEVDMVSLHESTFKPLWALEIKWSNHYVDHPEKLKSLVSFCKSNNFDTAWATTIDILTTKTYEGLNIVHIPSSVYAYTVGYNTLVQKQGK
ncbi:MAG TPA: ATPase [Bacteroidetes bacterium]|nr:ATPase [Bacteroidota bacterium]